MNIKNELLAQHSKSNTLKIATYIANDKKRFKSLMDVFLKGELIYAQRASWVMSQCVEANPKLIEPYLKKVLINLNKSNLHNAIIRNTVRALQYVKIPSNILGLTYGQCYKLLTNREQAPAIKAFAMTVLANICKQEPELKHELISIIKNEIEHENASYKARAKKVLTQLNKKDVVKQ